MDIKIVNRWPTRISPEDRRIDVEAFGRSARNKALGQKKWVIDLHEGTGEYQTEVAVAVADPDGLTVVWIGRTSGTAEHGAMANHALFGSSPALGYGANVQYAADASWQTVKAEHAKHWSPLERLARQAE